MYTCGIIHLPLLPLIKASPYLLFNYKHSKGGGGGGGYGGINHILHVCKRYTPVHSHTPPSAPVLCSYSRPDMQERLYNTCTADVL